MRLKHAYRELSHLTKQKHIAYIKVNTARETLSWQKRI